MPRRVLTADEADAVLRERRLGHPMLHIAEALQVPLQAVEEVCRDADMIRLGVDVGGQRFQRWTPEQDALLQDLAGAGLPINDLSYALSRSAHSIRKRLDHLRLSVARSSTKAEWTPANVAMLRQMIADGIQLTDIGRHFGTSPGAISKKMAKLKIRMSTRLNERERTGLHDCLRHGWTSPARISRQIGVPVEIVQHHMLMREAPAA